MLGRARDADRGGHADVLADDVERRSMNACDYRGKLAIAVIARLGHAQHRELVAAEARKEIVLAQMLPAAARRPP